MAAAASRRERAVAENFMLNKGVGSETSVWVFEFNLGRRQKGLCRELKKPMSHINVRRKKILTDSLTV